MFLEAQFYFCIKTQNCPLTYKTKYPKFFFLDFTSQYPTDYFSVLTLIFQSKVLNCTEPLQQPRTKEVKHFKRNVRSLWKLMAGIFFPAIIYQQK